RAFLQEKLPSYMVPTAFAVLPALPRTPNGKIDRRALPPVESAQAPTREVRAARTSLEAQVQQVWEEVLKVRPVGITDDFFELGGDSLLAVRLFIALEKKLGIRLPLGSLFQGATIEHLVEVLQRPAPATSPVVVGIQSRGTRPPFFAV